MCFFLPLDFLALSACVFHTLQILPLAVPQFSPLLWHFSVSFLFIFHSRMTFATNISKWSASPSCFYLNLNAPCIQLWICVQCDENEKQTIPWNEWFSTIYIIVPNKCENMIAKWQRKTHRTLHTINHRLNCWCWQRQRRNIPL